MNKKLALLALFISVFVLINVLMIPPLPVNNPSPLIVTSAHATYIPAVKAEIQNKSFVLNAALATDDFLLWKTAVAITITDIYGVLQSGTNVVGGLDECDSDGANPVAVDSDITFDGSLDQDDGSLTNGGIDAGDWIKWHTTSVNAPGFLTVTVNYTVD